MRAAALILASMFIGMNASAAARVYRPSDPSEIVLELERVAPSDGTESSLTIEVERADALQRRHSFAAAESLLTQVLARYPRDAEARLMRAQVRIHLRDAKRALEDCVALATMTDSLTTTACIAQARALAGDRERAYALISIALNAGGGSPAVRSWAAGIAGDLAAALGRHADAGSWYEAMYRLDPENHYARLQYGQWLLESGRSDEAARIGLRTDSVPRTAYRDAWLELWRR